MNQRNNKFFLLCLLVIFIMTGCKDIFQKNEEIPAAPLRYRLINTRFTDPIVNVSINKKSGNDLAYLSATTYELVSKDSSKRYIKITSPNVNLKNGLDTLDIIPRDSYTSGDQDPTLKIKKIGDRPLLKSTSYTALIAPKLSDVDQSNKPDSLQVILLADNPAASIPGRFQFRIVNLMTDSEGVSFVSSTGASVGFGGEGLKFGETSFSYFTEPVGKFSFKLYETSNGTVANTVYDFEPINIPSDKNYTVVVSGTKNETDNYPLKVIFYEEGGNGIITLNKAPVLLDKRPNVRFIQTDFTIPDQVSGVYYKLDLKVNNNPFFSQIGYKEVSSSKTVSYYAYSKLDVGNYSLQLTPHNEFDASFPKSDISFDDSSPFNTILAVPPAPGFPAKLIKLIDKPALNPALVSYRLINLSPDLGAVDVHKTSKTGPLLFSNLSFGAATTVLTSSTSGIVGDLYLTKAGTSTLVSTIHTADPNQFVVGSAYSILLVGAKSNVQHPFEVIFCVDAIVSDRYIGTIAIN